VKNEPIFVKFKLPLHGCAGYKKASFITKHLWVVYQISRPMYTGGRAFRVGYKLLEHTFTCHTTKLSHHNVHA